MMHVEPSKGRNNMATNMIGPHGQLYADPHPGKDENVFRVDNNSSQYYNSPYYLRHKNDVQKIPPSRNTQPLDLADYLPADVFAGIKTAGKISFHTVGDTGAAKVNKFQTVGTAIENEAHVADTMTADLAAPGSNAPAFFFHLGDVIYNFGEARYYYDQFYEPFRGYDRPIFAIPGNHDGMVFGQSSTEPSIPTLAAFQANFCAPKSGPSPDSGGLVRSVMTQPGVYFTLDAPFVSVIGLYSNVLDSGAGVISSQGGHFPISDEQLNFLTSELKRLKPEREAFKRAVVLAVHHPPLSADTSHGGSTGLQKDIDDCCTKAGLVPDVVLSGHAHLYQRFTRTESNGKETPYIVAGCGGFAVTAPKAFTQKFPVKGKDQTGDNHQLIVPPIVAFGYLTVETDAQTISVTFKTADKNGVAVRDAVAVDLKTGKITSSGGAGKSTPAGKKRGKGKSAGGKSRPPKRSGKKTTKRRR
jgi:hypothetical protein